MQTRPVAKRLGGILATLAMISLGAIPARAASVPPPPAAGWLFDDGAGTTAVDSWGPRHGTLQGGMGDNNWLSTTPKSYSGNRCLSFDGINDRVLVSLGHILTAFTSSTVSAWFHWTDTAPRKEYAIYSERDECQYNVFIVEIEDRLALPGGVAHGVFHRNPFPAVCGSGTWNVARATTGLPSSESWHHVVAIRKPDGEVRIFLDQTLVSVETGIVQYMGPDGMTTIGHTHTVGYDSYFAGKLDEIAVWTSALTDDEAAWLYEHSLRDLLFVGVGDDTRARVEEAKLTAGPLPFRAGSLRIVLMRPGMPAEGEVRAVLTDASGRLVRELTAVAHDGQPAIFTWDGTDGSGRAVPAGLYLLSTGTSAGRSSLKIPVIH